MPAFTIPTIYTAVDKYSAPVKAMERANASFGSRLEATAAKSERFFRKLTPGLSDATKQMLSFASSAALVSGAIAAGAFSVKSIMDYETAIQSLQAVTGVSNSELVGFKAEIADLANTSNKSSIDIAKSFEVIGSAMSEYLSDPKGLRQIAEAGITLSRASKMELEPTLQALTSVMNQFGLKAEMASDTINRLTAGEIVGSVSTSKIAEYLQEFGASAKLANINVGESVALIEALGIQMKSDKIAVGARNLLTVLDSAKGLDKNAQASLKKSGVNLSFLMDKSKSLSERLHELSKIQNDAVGITNVFGKENKTAAQVIFSQLDKYDQFEAAIQKTNKANDQAATNSNTLAIKLENLKNKWINMLTGSEAAGEGLNKVKDIIGFVTEHLDTIVSVGLKVIKFYALWKAANIFMNGLLLINNIRLGINNALKLQSIALLEGNAVATTASAVASDVMAASIAVSTGNMAAFNAVLMANPIGAVILALGALALAFYGVSKAVDEFDKPLNAAFIRQEQIREETFRVQDLVSEYMKLHNLTQAQAQKKLVNEEKQKTLGQLQVARAGLESLDPKVREESLQKINQIEEFAKRYQNPNEIFTKDIGQRYANSREIKSFVGNIGPAQTAPQVDWLSDSLVNPGMQGNENNGSNELKGKIEVDFKNVPQGAEVKTDSKFISVNTSSTMLRAAN